MSRYEIMLKKTGNNLLQKFSIIIDSVLGFTIGTYSWLLPEDKAFTKMEQVNE